MRIITIPKKSGGTRLIYACNKQESIEFRNKVGELNQKALILDKDNVMHGFVRGRSPVTMAKAHIGYKWTVCFDLKDFFDNVDAKKLEGLLPKELIKFVIVDGAARQGLPTSPAAANIAAHTLDKSIKRFLDKKKINCIYTRYADDLSISGNDTEQIGIILSEIPQIIHRCGWELRIEKTHVQLAKNGRRHICGVAVDDNGIYPTRRIKRKLRAAIHQNKESHARGLKEWCKLKEPKNKKISFKNELFALSSVWKIRIPQNVLYRDTFIDGDFMLTGDPVYIIGCSTWTTGWTSCLSHPSGKYRKGSIFWAKSKGTEMAALLSSSVKEINGVVRRKMRARAFVHTFRDGTKAYDRIYGEEGSKQELENKLKSIGIVSVTTLPSGLKTLGNVKYCKPVPYLDNLKYLKVTIKDTKHKAVVLTT